MEVPDRLVGIGKVVGQEPTTVHLREDAGVSPTLTGGGAVFLWGLAGAEVEDVDHEQIAGLSAVDLDWSAQHVRHAEIHVADVVGRVVVAELGIRPFATLDPKLASGLDG